VPDFASQVPRDPINGEPLRYSNESDGFFLLYSIGDDAVDNGGDTTMPETVAGSGTYRNMVESPRCGMALACCPEEIQTISPSWRPIEKTVATACSSIREVSRTLRPG